MRRTPIILGILLVLLGLSLYLVFEKKSPSEEEQKAFQTPEIAQLTKVELKDRQGNLTVLNKLDGAWLVDGIHPVSKVTLNDLLYAIEHMEAAYPAPLAATNNVLTQMVSSSTKVSLFKNGKQKPFKVFSVGGPTHEQDGTYMIMEIDGEAADKPYVVKLPGFRGYLTYRFSAIRNFWIGTQFTKLLAEEIKGIDVQYFQEDSGQSFQLNRSDEGFVLKQESTMIKEEDLNIELIEGYFNAFMDLSFERYIDTIPNQDSIMQHMHYADIQLDLVNGEKRKLSTYLKPFKQQENLPLDQSGKALQIDPDKLFAFDHQSQSFFTIQYYTFGKLFMKADQLKN